MSTTETALTAHLVMPDAAADDDFLARVAGEMMQRFAIGHTTLQIERREDSDCRQAPDSVV
jgi:cobalt-zinc-cadmium efflux system protein